MNHNSVLGCRSVNRRFQIGQTTVEVLRNINFDILRGQMVSIVGASGSGKTTLLNLLAGLDDPSEGVVSMIGSDLSTLNDRQRAETRNKHMGFVFQFHHLLPEFSALDNVLMPCRINGPVKTEQQAYAKHLLNEVGLGDRMNHRPSELSGGERQRVAIARSLVRKPDVVLMDEPTGNLDEETSEQIQKLITSLNMSNEASFVIVTHNQEWARNLPIQFKLMKGQLTQIV